MGNGIGDAAQTATPVTYVLTEGNSADGPQAGGLFDGSAPADSSTLAALASDNASPAPVSAPPVRAAVAELIPGLLKITVSTPGSDTTRDPEGPNARYSVMGNKALW